MAHLKNCDGVPALAGVTRIKSFRDPLTREVVDFGPNEMYLMEAIFFVCLHKCLKSLVVA